MKTRIPLVKTHASRNGHLSPVSRDTTDNTSNILNEEFTVQTSGGKNTLKAGDILKVFVKHRKECDGKEGIEFNSQKLPSHYISILINHFKLTNLLEMSKIMSFFIENSMFNPQDQAKRFFKLRMNDSAEAALEEWSNSEEGNGVSTVHSDDVAPEKIARPSTFGEVATSEASDSIGSNEDQIDWTTLISDITKEKDTTTKIIDRPNNLSRLKRELSKTLTHNVFVVGENGVGKSSLITQLANDIVDKKAGKLNERKIYKISLSVPELVEVMPEIYKFAKQYSEVTFYFDNVEAVFISQDEVQARMLRELDRFISDPDIKTIFEMTNPTALRLLSKNSNWENLTSQIKIEEPDLETTLAIMKEKVAQVEKAYSLSYKEVNLERTIDLCENYITNFPFPKSVLDVLDIAGAVASTEDRDKVTMEDVSLALSEITGLPLGTINEDERQKLLRIDSDLSDRVLGQPEAIAKVSNAIRRRRARLVHKLKGLVGNFIFVGPTGVGKTELAKALAEWLTGDENNMARLDMSEFMESHNVSRLIGAPPGYVGYEEGGQLTNVAKKRPFGVVLLDEIEKAHRSVFNILLPLMDEGRLTDGHGDTVDFKNYILIMTGNISAEQIQEIIGHAKRTGSKDGSDPKTQTQINAAVSEGLQYFFTPEQLNRVDEVIVFKDLPEEIQKDIVKKKLDKYLSAVKHDSDITVNPTDDAIEFLKSKLFERKSEVYDRQGGRKAEDVLKNHVEIPLTNYVLENGIKNGAILEAYFDLATTSICFKELKKTKK